VKDNTTGGCDALFIGYEDEENLGLRSIAAFLVEHGLRVKIEPYQKSSKENILARIIDEKPKLVGFSLIFQRMLFEFADLMAYLRKNGVTTHFTIGGHFPTIEYTETLESIPEVDTVVRHEGEQTLLELFQHLDNPDLWSQINGLAYRKDGRIEVPPPRPLIADLDTLPFPLRSNHVTTYRGLGIRSILASRGCHYNCSFCSVQQFYRDAPGSKRRSRSPSNVAQEIEELFSKYNTRIFIFKDDDLGLKSPKQDMWIEEFARELKIRKISDKIIWRISCRVDEVNLEMLRNLKEVGLTFLYLGIESGSKQGLKTFNKGYSVNQIYNSVSIIEKLGMNFEYGFMLLDPDSTICSIKENTAFLRELSKDGRTVVHFTKMFPYVGTSITRRLKDEGRLKGTITSQDYDFRDSKLDLLEYFFLRAFNTYLSGNGLASRLKMAKFDTIILDKFFPDLYETQTYSEAIRDLTCQNNASVLNTINYAVNFIEDHNYEEIISNWSALENIAKDGKIMELKIAEALNQVMACYNLEHTS
jgi:radical SAM superfamily enzyme YgiQ (UPF0313 family)